MRDIIFKKGTCLKGDIFNVLISKFQEGGWTVLNPLPEEQKTYIDLYSPGSTGNHHKYFRFYPFDVIGSVAPAYDIRTTTYTDFYFRQGKGYDSVTKSMSLDAHNYLWCFVSNRSTASAGRTYSRDLPFDYYYYCDKDIMAWYTAPTEGSGLSAYSSFMLIGEPEETYLVERQGASEIPYSGSIVAASGTMTMGAGNNTMGVLNKPESLPESASYAINSYSMSPPSAKNADGNYQLFQQYAGIVGEGTRFKIGYVHWITGEALDGDIIEIDLGTAIHRYRVCSLGTPYASRNSFPTRFMLIRIE